MSLLVVKYKYSIKRIVRGNKKIMRNYYYSAWNSKEEMRSSIGKPSVRGWILAKNIEEAEKIIAERGLVRNSITYYTKRMYDYIQENNLSSTNSW